LVFLQILAANLLNPAGILPTTRSDAMWKGKICKVDQYRFEIPKDYKPGMLTSGIIYADDRMMELVMRDESPEQVANVATLPDIVGSSLAMPDIHYGYGFPIGGVAAMDADRGVISPGGVGYDINCGVRMVRTNLDVKDVQPKIKALVDHMFENVPSGVGSKGKIRLKGNEIEDVLENGAEWAVAQGFGWKDDLEMLEERGRMQNADSACVSRHAKDRGVPQLGTLGAGNHFLEIQKVAEIFEPDTARAFGIERKDQIIVMIHTGSRGCGYQIAEDYINEMRNAVRKYNIPLADRELVSAPFNSPEGQQYFNAMACGANYAWANRQLILHWVRESFAKVLGNSPESMDMRMVYDVCHNIAKLEEHEFEGKRIKVVVHRKGATRAFAKGRPELPQKYSSVGQPVLIPGDMGTASYVLVGTELALKQTWGSTCHGAGRVMSRNEAIRRFKPEQIRSELAGRGIYVRAASRDVLTEEAPSAYKRVDDVVRICDGAGISKIVAKMVPLGVMKG
jgi:tRNA-splicing ligase RtcB